MVEFQVEFLKTLEDGVRLVPDLEKLEKVDQFKVGLTSKPLKAARFGRCWGYLVGQDEPPCHVVGGLLFFGSLLRTSQDFPVGGPSPRELGWGETPLSSFLSDAADSIQHIYLLMSPLEAAPSLRLH